MHSPKIQCDLIASRQHLWVQLSVVGFLLLHLILQSHIWLITELSYITLFVYCLWVVGSFFLHRPQHVEFICQQSEFSLWITPKNKAFTVQRVFMTPWFCVFMGGGRKRYLLWFDQINSRQKWALSKQLQYWRQNIARVDKNSI